MPGKFVHIEPWVWPQDSLAVPNGYGGLPDVTRQNSREVRREFYAYSDEILSIGAGATSQVVIPTEQDGDFWAVEFCCLIAATAVPQTFVTTLNPLVQITDLKTAYQMCYPTRGARANLFRREVASRYRAFATPTFTPQSTFPQPYCFTRDSAIQVRVTNDSATPLDFHFSFNGWKEYRNAAF